MNTVPSEEEGRAFSYDWRTQEFVTLADGSVQDAHDVQWQPATANESAGIWRPSGSGCILQDADTGGKLARYERDIQSHFILLRDDESENWYDQRSGTSKLVRLQRRDHHISHNTQFCGRSRRTDSSSRRATRRAKPNEWQNVKRENICTRLLGRAVPLPLPRGRARETRSPSVCPPLREGRIPNRRHATPVRPPDRSLARELRPRHTARRRQPLPGADGHQLPRHQRPRVELLHQVRRGSGGGEQHHQQQTPPQQLDTEPPRASPPRVDASTPKNAPRIAAAARRSRRRAVVGSAVSPHARARCRGAVG